MMLGLLVGKNPKGLEEDTEGECRRHFQGWLVSSVRLDWRSLEHCCAERKHQVKWREGVLTSRWCRDTYEGQKKHGDQRNFYFAESGSDQELTDHL